MHGTAAVGTEVAVVGGGNSAIDAARTALRLGAKHVTILYRRQREQMPAWAEEIHAADEEGITVLPLTSPKEILRDDAGQGHRRALPAAWRWATTTGAAAGAPVAGRNPDFTVECDQVIAAIGQSLDAKALVGDLPVELNATAGSRPTERPAPPASTGSSPAATPSPARPRWWRPSPPASGPRWPSTST